MTVELQSMTGTGPSQADIERAEAQAYALVKSGRVTDHLFEYLVNMHVAGWITAETPDQREVMHQKVASTADLKVVLSNMANNHEQRVLLAKAQNEDKR